MIAHRFTSSKINFDLGYDIGSLLEGVGLDLFGASEIGDGHGGKDTILRFLNCSIRQTHKDKFKLARLAGIHFYLNRTRIDAHEGCGLCDS